MARAKLQLLGGFSVRSGSGAALSLGSRKVQALLAFLGVPVGRTHPRDKLATLLWGDTGDEQVRQSLRQALGMRPLVAHCHLGLGDLHRTCGERAQAEQHLSAAARMYREMGMPFWEVRASEASVIG